MNEITCKTKIEPPFMLGSLLNQYFVDIYPAVTISGVDYYRGFIPNEIINAEFEGYFLDNIIYHKSAFEVVNVKPFEFGQNIVVKKKEEISPIHYSYMGIIKQNFSDLIPITEQNTTNTWTCAKCGYQTSGTWHLKSEHWLCHKCK